VLRKGNSNGQDCCDRLRTQHPSLRSPARCDRSRADGLGPHIAAQRRPSALRPLRLAAIDFGAWREVLSVSSQTYGPGFFPGPFFVRVCFLRTRVGQHHLRPPATNSPQRQNGATQRIACWHLEYQTHRQRSDSRQELIAGMEGAFHQHRLCVDGSPDHSARQCVAPLLSQRRGCCARCAFLQFVRANFACDGSRQRRRQGRQLEEPAQTGS
jgi:hypothetical protein